MIVELTPARTAILLLDVQNDLVAITPGIKQNRVLENMAAVLRAGRKAGAEIIHITASVRSDFRDIPQDNPLWVGIRQAKAMIIGTKGAQIHPKVKPLKRELVLNKSCVDPYLTTNLDQALQNADANTLVIMGLWTNYVVEATARHASDMGFRVFVVRDCCAGNIEEYHLFAMDKMLPTLCYVVKSDEVLGALA